MSNQQPPYNPFMFPFPYHYPPPPFMNPMMPPPSRNPSAPPPGELSSVQKPFPMPPFGYPPYPMMYPPPPYQYFPYYEPKVHPKDNQVPHSMNISKEPFYLVQSKKIKTGETTVSEKKQAPFIVLSDDESKQQVKPRAANAQKQSLEHRMNQQKDMSFEPRPRRTVRKIVSSVKQDPPALKVRPQFKKKQHIQQQQKKSKTQKPEEKEVKPVGQVLIQFQTQTFIRPTRSKFLTAKDGKGKIMIGDEYQATLPIFLPRNEIITVWMDQRKSGLLTRFVK